MEKQEKYLRDYVIDVMNSRTPDVLSLKIDCLRDRRYWNIPSWFYEYIDTELLLNLILVECGYGNPKSIDSNFIKFMVLIQYQKTQKIDVKFIINTLIQYDMFSYCVLLDLKSVYNYGKKNYNNLTEDMVLELIECCIRYRNCIPYEFVKLYLMVTMSCKSWSFKPSIIISSKLSELYSYMEEKSMKDSSIALASDMLYQVIYTKFIYYIRNHIHKFKKMDPRYYWDNGGTFIDKYMSLLELKWFLISKQNTACEFNMDAVVYIMKRWTRFIDNKPMLSNDRRFLSSLLTNCKQLILQSSIYDNANNLKCVYWELNQYERSLVIDIISSKHSPIISFNSFNNLDLFIDSNPIIKNELLHITLPDVKKIITGYIQRGGDPYSFFSNIYEIKYVPEDIVRVIVVHSSVEHIVELCDYGYMVSLAGVNDGVTPTDFNYMGFVDYVVYMILQSGQLFLNEKYMTLIFDKLFDKISDENKESIIRSVNTCELFTKYPTLITYYNDMISLDEKRLLLEKNPTSLPYLIQHHSIPYEWCIHAIQRVGYIKFSTGYIMQYIPPNHIFQLLKSGCGSGYILDLIIPSMRNALIIKLLD